MNRVNHSSKTTTTAKPILRILSILAILVQTIAFTACSSDDGKGDGGNPGGKKGPQWCSTSAGGIVMCFEVGKKIKTDNYACYSVDEFEGGFFPEGKCEEMIENSNGFWLTTLESSKPENCIAYHCTEE